MLTGEAGYLGLQENLEDKITLGEDIITNAVVPGKQQMLVFASPQSHGSYQVLNMMQLPLHMKTLI